MSGIYCECGCGAELPKARYASWQSKYVHNHHRNKSPVAYIIDENNCWLWQRSISADGYAQAGGQGRSGKAHTQFYREKFGDVPEGCELHHTCEVRHCVNPDHLEPLTRLEHRRKHPRRTDGVPSAA